MQIDTTCMLWHYALETEDRLFIRRHTKKNVSPSDLPENIDTHV